MNKELVLYGKNANGRLAIVDDDDYRWLSSYRWHADVRGYVYTFVKGVRIYLHRLVMNASGNEIIDHKNHNRLDNRKSNLRKCTNSQNQANTKSWRGKDTKGISLYGKKWVVRIMVNGTRLYLGRYEKKEDAIKVYNNKSKELFGEFAYLESNSG